MPLPSPGTTSRVVDGVISGHSNGANPVKTHRRSTERPLANRAFVTASVPNEKYFVKSLLDLRNDDEESEQFINAVRYLADFLEHAERKKALPEIHGEAMVIELKDLLLLARNTGTPLLRDTVVGYVALMAKNVRWIERLVAASIIDFILFLFSEGVVSQILCSLRTLLDIARTERNCNTIAQSEVTVRVIGIGRWFNEDLRRYSLAVLANLAFSSHQNRLILAKNGVMSLAIEGLRYSQFNTVQQAIRLLRHLFLSSALAAEYIRVGGLPPLFALVVSTDHSHQDVACELVLAATGSGLELAAMRDTVKRATSSDEVDVVGCKIGNHIAMLWCQMMEECMRTAYAHMGTTALARLLHLIKEKYTLAFLVLGRVVLLMDATMRQVCYAHHESVLQSNAAAKLKEQLLQTLCSDDHHGSHKGAHDAVGLGLVALTRSLSTLTIYAFYELLKQHDIHEARRVGLLTEEEQATLLSAPAPPPPPINFDSTEFVPVALDFPRFTRKFSHSLATPLRDSLRDFISVVTTELSISPTTDISTRVHEFLTLTEDALGDHPLWREASETDRLNDMECIENLVMSKLHSKVFATDDADRARDHALSAHMSALQHVLQPHHLDIAPAHREENIWTQAQGALHMMAAAITPQDKLDHLLRCCRLVYCCGRRSPSIVHSFARSLPCSPTVAPPSPPDPLARASSEVVGRRSSGTLLVPGVDARRGSRGDTSEEATPAESESSRDGMGGESPADFLPMGADEFLPIFIYNIIMANPKQIHSNMEYISKYRHPSRMVSAPAYFLASMAGAVQYIESLDCATLTKETDAKSKSDASTTPTTATNAAISTTTNSTTTTHTTPTTPATPATSTPPTAASILTTAGINNSSDRRGEEEDDDDSGKLSAVATATQAKCANDVEEMEYPKATPVQPLR